MPVLELDLELRFRKAFCARPFPLDALFVARFPRHLLQTQVDPRHEPTGGNSVPRPASFGQSSRQAATAAPSPARVSTTGPAAVHARVCSKCAERLRSAVTTVHWSSSVRVSGPPTFTIGSIAMQSPSPIGGVGGPPPRL